MTGLCGLCRQIGELQESHLLPRAAYKHVRGLLAGVEGDPVTITPKSARITSTQVKTPFLCSPCWLTDKTLDSHATASWNARVRKR